MIRRSAGGLWTCMRMVCSVPARVREWHLLLGIQIHIQWFSTFHTFPYALGALQAHERVSTGKNHRRAILEIEFIETNNAMKGDQRCSVRRYLRSEFHDDEL